MYSEEDLLPLSALTDLAYCERRAALHHLEGLWEDNVYTIEGSYLHQKADQPGTELRPGVRIGRAVPLRSMKLGLSGKADVVEFLLGSHTEGVETPFPVDYKRGRLPKWEQPCWEIQLCAQAICLEEMLCVGVPKGAIYFGKSRRRLEVTFTPDLRKRTEVAALRLHELFTSRVTPGPVFEPKCEKCSLVEDCMPRVSSGGRSAIGYLKAALRREASNSGVGWGEQVETGE